MPAPVPTTRVRGRGLYRSVLSRPAVHRPVVGTGIASLPIGMLGLAVLLLVRSSTGAFAHAGLVVAALSVGTGAGIAVQGRLLDRFAASRVLLPAAVVQLTGAIALIASVRNSAPLAVTATCAVLLGLGEPQVGGCLRGLWPRLIPPGERETATALSSLLLEGSATAGPLLLAGVLLATGPAGAVLTGTGLSGAGAWLLARSRAARSQGTPTRSAHTGGWGAWADPTVRSVAAVAATQGVTGGLVQVAAAAAAAETGHPGRTPLLYAALSSGSLAGVLLAGAHPCSGSRTRRLVGMLLLTSGATAATALAPDVLMLAAGLGIVGLASGPAAMTAFTLVQQAGTPGSAVEASTALVAAGLGGLSAGTAAGGLLVDAVGPRPLLAAAAAVGLTVAVTFHLGSTRPRARTDDPPAPPPAAPLASVLDSRRPGPCRY